MLSNGTSTRSSSLILGAADVVIATVEEAAALSDSADVLSDADVAAEDLPVVVARNVFNRPG